MPRDLQPIDERIPRWSKDNTYSLELCAEKFMAVYYRWRETGDHSDYRLLHDHISPLVITIASSYLKELPHYIEKDELVSAAYVAVWNNLYKNFTPEPDVSDVVNYKRLFSCLSTRILGSMKDYLRENSKADGFNRTAKTKGKIPKRVSLSELSEVDAEDYFDQLIAVSRKNNPVLEHAEITDFLNKMGAITGQFKDRYQEIFRLYLVVGLSMKEIGDELGISEGLVSYQFRDAVVDCLSCLGETVESVGRHFDFEPNLKPPVNPRSAVKNKQASVITEKTVPR